ncbi:hypothetical protein B0J11DRAFT_476154 [Dendryphion nanum]|uniref:Zn(2)-C6 fungal-type domain-containing protein n=1 Tax=Dendryphion nanum TaxID=256645 RepID=A0A9P9EK23_9PLEO|nr:hypothetical protein B0J11DRAFT_476154 [Dendryphion nanum]
MATVNNNADTCTGMDRVSTRIKRKIRKGTQSCWECKKRKTKCIFPKSSDSICVGCKSRRTTCIGQEFDDDSPMIRKHARPEETGSFVAQPMPQGNQVPGTTPRAVNDSSLTSSLTLASPRHADTYIAAPNTDNFYAITSKIAATWPCEQDLEIILSLQAGCSNPFHSVTCTPYFKCVCDDTPSPSEILKLPRPGSHPVQFAKKLLLLAIFLQSIPSCSQDTSLYLSVTPHDLMCLISKTATRLVTSHDEFVESIEGVECIIMESMQHNSLGSLRRAYLSIHRAIAIALTMGLHRHGQRSLTRTPNPDSNSQLRMGHIWFRLVQSDRYLSLMLGLPLARPDRSFANQESLNSCTPMEAMGRIICVASERILQRNQVDILHPSWTKEIDNLLRKASNYMLPQWWLVPDISSHSTNKTGDTTRLMYHFTHYFLVTQLHLPYLLQRSDENQYDYSKLTAINASREILTRFILLRSTKSRDVFCRGVDFIAFIACMVLCLAHIMAGGTGDSLYATSNRPDRAFDSIIHQRLSDRGLLERTLEIMDRIVLDSQDTIALKIVHILRPLLVIGSATSTDDAMYCINCSFGEESYDLGCSGEMNDSGDTLCIFVPHLGKVTLERVNFTEMLSAESDRLVDPPILNVLGLNEYALSERSPSLLQDNSNVENILVNEMEPGDNGVRYQLSEQFLTRPPEETNWFLQDVEATFID